MEIGDLLRVNFFRPTYKIGDKNPKDQILAYLNEILTAQLLVLSDIELMTKFVGASSFDIEFPSSSLVGFLHPKNARYNTDAARIAVALEKNFVKTVQ